MLIQSIVLLWNLLDSAGGGIAFWSVGYAFAYGGDSVSDGNATFVGNRGFFMQNDTIRFENWFFQFAFACAVSCTSCSRIFITVPSVTTLSQGSEIYNVACVFSMLDDISFHHSHCCWYNRGTFTNAGLFVLFLLHRRVRISGSSTCVLVDPRFHVGLQIRPIVGHWCD